MRPPVQSVCEKQSPTMEKQSCSSVNQKEAIKDLPPSAKLVFKALEYEGGLTQQKLAESTHLSTRTVRYATARLEENELITSRIHFADARQHIYSLAEGSEDGAESHGR